MTKVNVQEGSTCIAILKNIQATPKKEGLIGTSWMVVGNCKTKNLKKCMELD